MTSEFGALFVVLGAAYFSVQGQRGGCTGKKRGGVPAPHSLKSFVFRGLSLLIGFPRADTAKSGETIATPPKRVVPPGPDSGTVFHAPIPAPGGRYRRYLSLREGSEKTPRSGVDQVENGPMELRKNWRKLTTALSRFWHREAGPMNWKNPVRVTAYIGWGVFNGAAFLVGEWVRSLLTRELDCELGPDRDPPIPLSPPPPPRPAPPPPPSLDAPLPGWRPHRLDNGARGSIYLGDPAVLPSDLAGATIVV